MFGTEATIDKNDPTRSVFLIPEGNYGKLVEQIEKLSKRAKRLGSNVMKPFVVGYQTADDGTNMLEVYLDVGKVSIEGFTFVAKLDHSNETGTIVRALPNTGVEIPTQYRTAKPDCNHCNHNRRRRDTYVLRNDETGAFIQVGSTCLSDFLGVDAAFYGKLAELFSYAAEVASHGGGTTGAVQDRRFIILDELLANTAAVVRNEGWVPAYIARERDIPSTRERAMDNMFVAYRTLAYDVTAADRAFAQEALERTLRFEDKETLSDYESNCLVIAKAVVIEGRSAGLAASIVGCYYRELQRNKPKPQKVQLGDMRGIHALFQTAGSRIQYPKIAISFDETPTIVLSVTKTGPNAGSVNVCSEGVYGKNDFFGRVRPNGEFQPNSRIDQPKGLEAGLLAFAADPAAVAAAHGHKTGNCCFCRKKLKDTRSTFVGYGQTCAANYNLPWGAVA